MSKDLNYFRILLFVMAIGLSFEGPLHAVETEQKTPKKPIAEEISQVEKDIEKLKQDAATNKKEIEKLERYLKIIQPKEAPQPCDPQVPSEIGKNFRTKILNSITWLDKEKDLSISSKTLFELFEYIKNNKQKWREWKKDPSTGAPPIPFQLPNENKSNVTFDIDSKGNILVSFEDKVLGEGTFKTVKKVVGYKTWTNLARGFVKPYDSMTHTPEDQKMLEESWKKEGKILKEIMGLPQDKKRNLVETLSWSKQDVVQVLYEMDLETAMNGKNINGKMLIPPTPLTQEEKMDGLTQTTDALLQLEAMGILHNDIKAENILLSSNEHPDGKTHFVWVVTDFGLSIRPQELIAAGKHREPLGSPMYMAPETIRGLWSSITKAGEQSTTQEEKVKNAFKGDVFSLALMAYELINGKQFPILTKCAAKAKSRKEFWTCRDHAINNWINPTKETDTNEGNGYSSLDLFFKRALHLYPTKRISLEQFREGLTHLKAKKPDLTTKVPLEELLQQKDLGIVNKDTTEVAVTLQTQPIGTYVLRAAGSNQEFRVGISYLNQNKKVVSKTLDISPKDPDQIQNEINFLKTIGIINSQLK